MEEFNKNLADKYFKDQCTPEEAKRVLQWLDTTEGQSYLDEMIETGLEASPEDKNLNEVYYADGLDTEKLLSSILSRIRRIDLLPPVRNFGYKIFFRVAASVLVILSATLLYQANKVPTPLLEEPEITWFSTGAEEQRQIRLADGSSIRLNSNSELTVSVDYLDGSREVTLKGEAFFEVAHQAGNHFTIQTDYAEVEVLGTSFNVKSVEGSHRAEVSVVDGKVAFQGNFDERNRRTTLEKGEYAYWDELAQELKSEQFGAQNYLAWMTDQLIFEDLPLSKVCIQLNRFYDISCRFDSENIQSMGLNASIPNPNLQNTLSVIALSLDLDFQQENEKVVWKYSDSSE